MEELGDNFTNKSNGVAFSASNLNLFAVDAFGTPVISRERSIIGSSTKRFEISTADPGKEPNEDEELALGLSLSLPNVKLGIVKNPNRKEERKPWRVEADFVKCCEVPDRNVKDDFPADFFSTNSDPKGKRIRNLQLLENKENAPKASHKGKDELMSVSSPYETGQATLSDTSLLLETFREVLRGNKKSRKMQCGELEEVMDPFEKEKAGNNWEMESNCVPVSILNPESRRWKAKVILLEISNTFQPRDRSSSYQKLLFCDAEKNKIQAIIYGDDIFTVGDRLELYKTYYVYSARITEVQGGNRMTSSDYQWTLNRSTFIQPTPPENSLDLDRCFNLTPFCDLAKKRERDAEVDVLFAVIHVLPPKSVHTKKGPRMIQEFIIINEELNPIFLTFWENFINNKAAEIAMSVQSMPIILATRLKVGFYNGISLSPRSLTTFSFGPPLVETAKIRKWVQENHGFLHKIISERMYDTWNEPVQSPVMEHVRQIIDVATPSNLNKVAWIRGSISITNHTQEFHYMACKNCKKRTTAHEDYPFPCRFCENYEKPKVRGLAEAEILDASSSIIGSFFDSHAEKILGFSVEKILSKAKRNEELPVNSINTWLRDKTFYMKIKPYSFKSKGQHQIRCSVIALCKKPSDIESE